MQEQEQRIPAPESCPCLLLLLLGLRSLWICCIATVVPLAEMSKKGLIVADFGAMWVKSPQQ
jgi:hypothetical protein